MDYRIIEGDCIEGMRRLEGQSVHCCVTSPPYFGLRDYGHDGQIGLEASPDAFVAKLVEVFREVRRVLRDDGTVWLNLGDSYAGSWGNAGGHNRGNGTQREITVGSVVKDQAERNGDFVPPAANGYAELGIKKKDLIGIPWRVAFALQQPYYTGKIRKEADRIWLAAIIDGEGCFFIHKRKAGSNSGAKFKRSDGEEVNYARVADTYSVGLEICNTNLAIIERIQAVACRGSIRTQAPEQNSRRKQTIYRWRCSPSEAREIAQEVYPHLVGKQRQARLIYGAPTTGEDAAEAHQAIMDLHNGVETSVDLPEPPTMFEPGWYLRQDVIWAKPNPMPESVRDRCTKAHEYIFLLSKSERYYFNSEAMQEPASGPGKICGPKNDAMRGDGDRTGIVRGDGENRNRRSVWTVATKPYKGAHFATFPPDLIRPCILAGCPPKGKRCDCDEVIASPLGSGSIEDPTMQTGRAGMNRPRRDNEGTRPITRREQRHEAIEMKASPHRAEIERECGPAFAHYIRTDRSGARPLPHDIRKKYMEAGWITEAPSCTHPIEEAGTVLDPFGGSGTTAQVALEEGRKAVLCELNTDYIALAHKRLEGLQLRIE